MRLRLGVAVHELFAVHHVVELELAREERHAQHTYEPLFHAADEPRNAGLTEREVLTIADGDDLQRYLRDERAGAELQEEVALRRFALGRQRHRRRAVALQIVGQNLRRAFALRPVDEDSAVRSEDAADERFVFELSHTDDCELLENVDQRAVDHCLVVEEEAARTVVDVALLRDPEEAEAEERDAEVDLSYFDAEREEERVRLESEQNRDYDSIDESHWDEEQKAEPPEAKDKQQYLDNAIAGAALGGIEVR